MLKVFIIDESPFFRRWFSRLVLALPGIRIIGEASDSFSALKIIRRKRPDVIIMDVKTQLSFGVNLIGNIRKLNPIPKVIMVASEACSFNRGKISEKADYLLDKLTEYEKIPDILKRFSFAPIYGLKRPEPLRFGPADLSMTGKSMEST